MILTEEEYSKGFLDFDASIPPGGKIDVWTRTRGHSDESAEWFGPYTSTSGNKVLSDAKTYMQVRIDLKRGPDPYQSPVLKKIRWERDGLTHIFPGLQGWDGPPRKLSLGRDYGASYRVVYHPSKAVWDNPFVLIDQMVRIRFWNNPISGHRVIGFDDIEINSDGNAVVEGQVEEITSEGSVIEILATVPTENEQEGREQAKAQVEAIMGLLALWGGEQLLGKIVFEDFYFATPEDPEKGEIHIPFNGLLPLTVTQDGLDVTQSSLDAMRSSSIGGSIGLALRWYAKALNSNSPVDEFISYFIGIEALANGYFDSLEPSPIREQARELREYFDSASPQVKGPLRSFVLERLTDFPLSTKFDSYAESRFGADANRSKEFRRLNRIRGEILHGKLQDLTGNDLRQTQRLLENHLGAELHLESIVNGRHDAPTVLQATLRYALIQTARPEGQ